MASCSDSKMSEGEEDCVQIRTNDITSDVAVATHLEISDVNENYPTDSYCDNELDKSQSNSKTSTEIQARETTDERVDIEKANKNAKKSKPRILSKRKYRLRSSKEHDSDQESMSVDGENKEETSVNKENSSELPSSSSQSLEFNANKAHSEKNSKKRKKSSSTKKSTESKDSQKNQGDGVESTSDSRNDNSNEMDIDIKSRVRSSSSSDEYSSTSSDSSSSSSSLSSQSKRPAEEFTDDEEWLLKNTDKMGLPTWQSVEELRRRQYGCQSYCWQAKAIGSHGLVKRFERLYALDGHEGCVNALNFNQTGTLLASGSDDRNIKIWDFESGSSEPFISYSSGHSSNVFQAKFMPNSSDLTVITCARDGQVRVGYLSSTGTCRDTKKIAQHRGSAHKLALDKNGCKFTFLSCGEDSVVMEFDLRENKPARKLLSVKNGDSKIALYAIDTHPRDSYKFAVSGRDEWARVYDRRMVSLDSPNLIAKYSPHQFQSARTKPNITCLVYNYIGDELLCSYNDDDIYLFDATHSSEDDFKRKYKGHRNSATVKGVNFYGPRSEFIVSGSDCGNIYLWDKASSQIVRYMQGDEGGVVNVLEPHPNLPILATSGLDNNIKVWGPTGDGELDQAKLKKLMLLNRSERLDEVQDERIIDSHLLWFLMRTLRNARGRRERGDDSGDSSSSNSDDSDSDDDGDERRVDCMTS